MANTNVFRGSDGLLTLSAGDEAAEGQVAAGLIDEFEINPVGRAHDVRVHVDTELRAFHEIGRRHATQLRPGNIHVHGQIGRAHINGFLLRAMLGKGAQSERVAEPYPQPAFNLHVRLADPASEGVASNITILGVKFASWAFTLPEDDFVMESVSFRALSISVRDEQG